MMGPLENYYVDRTGWPPGPWDDEPDRFAFIAHGYQCLILRDLGGSLCGYVGVPPGHPLHGVDYMAETPVLAASLERRTRRPLGESPGVGLMIGLIVQCLDANASNAFEVHGGITFSGKEDELWWFGFDCAHCDDFVPSPSHVGHVWERVYRTMRYVVSECSSLASQLQAVAKEATVHGN
jgi:hypothetical protein